MLRRILNDSLFDNFLLCLVTNNRGYYRRRRCQADIDWLQQRVVLTLTRNLVNIDEKDFSERRARPRPLRCLSILGRVTQLEDWRNIVLSCRSRTMTFEDSTRQFARESKHK